MKRFFLGLFLSLFLVSCSSYQLMDNVKVSKITEPELKPIPATIGVYNYQLVKNWNFYFSVDEISYRGLVPKGWISDGTSVPRSVWTLSGITRDGLERGASWEHDWEYQHMGRIPLEEFKDGKWIPSTKTLTREETDNIFYRGMVKLKVPEKQAHTMFDMVRKFGYIPWNSHALSLKR